jgi:ankyrin repeat protein
MALASLPVELLTLIIQDTDRTAQASLSLVNRSFHALAAPILYRGEPHAVLFGARDGNIDTVKKAVSLGADINVRGPTGVLAIAKSACPPFDRKNLSSLTWSSALHFAAKNGDYDMSRWLLDHGADIDAPSWCLCKCETYPKGPIDEREPEMRLNPHPYFRRRWTPLHTAICHRRVSIIRLLISRGASMTVDTWRPKLKRVASPRGQRQNATALHWSAAMGLKSVVKDLIVSGKLDVNSVAMDNETPLHYACLASPDPSMVSLLLELGTDASIISIAFYNKSALMAACDTGNCAAALVLLKARADVLFGQPNFDSFMRMIKRPFLMDFSCVKSDQERKEREKAQEELCSLLLALIRRKVTDSKVVENILGDLFISAAWSQSPASVTTMKLILDAGLTLQRGEGTTMTTLKHALSQNDPDVLYRKAKLLFDNGADARVSGDPFLGLECPLTWFLGQLLRRNPTYASSRPWNLGVNEESYIGQAVHVVRLLLRNGAMENQRNEYGTSASYRFCELVAYEGKNRMLAYAAKLMAENFDLVTDPETSRDIIVDRLVVSDEAAAKTMADARARLSHSLRLAVQWRSA